MNKTLNLIIRLLLITVMAALVLSLINGLTAPVISERQAEEFKASYAIAYPEGNEFKVIEENVNEYIKEVIEVDAGTGYVFNAEAPGGYGGVISYIIGVDKAGVIQGFRPITHSETQGYGSKMEDADFVDGVTGVDISSGVSYGSGNKEMGEIQNISGATRTVNALTKSFQEVAMKMSDLSDEIETIGETIEPYFAGLYEENFDSLFSGVNKWQEVTNDIKVENFVRILDAFKDDELLGHVVQVKSTGFGGDINLLLAVDLDSKIQKYVVASHGETPDYGAVIDTEIYENTVIGNTLTGRTKLKSAPTGQRDIQLISGATVTSMAMQDAFNGGSNGLKAYHRANELGYELIDIKALAEEEAKANAPAVDYAAEFGVGDVEAVGEDLLNDNVQAIHRVDTGGYIIDVSSKAGFSPAGISVGILVDEAGIIQEWKYYNFAETPDYGGTAGEVSYIEKLVGKSLMNGPFQATDSGDGQGEVQNISGATLTVNAMIEILDAAADAFSGLK